MKRKKFKTEQIVVMLRETEIQMAKGLDVAQVSNKLTVMHTKRFTTLVI